MVKFRKYKENETRKATHEGNEKSYGSLRLRLF